MPRALTWSALAVGVPYAAALAAVAFWATPVDAGYSTELDAVIAWLSRRGLGAIDYEVIESAANAALFVPLGVLAALPLPARWSWLAVVLGAAVSSVIETAQLFLLPARFATAHDVLMNTLGAALGAVLGAALRSWLVTRERRRAAELDLAFAHIPLRGASGVLGDRPAQRR